MLGPSLLIKKKWEYPQGPSLAHRQNAIWWPNIECWLGSIVIFQWILASIAKKPYIFCFFREDPGPCPHPLRIRTCSVYISAIYQWYYVWIWKLIHSHVHHSGQRRKANILFTLLEGLCRNGSREVEYYIHWIFDCFISENIPHTQVRLHYKLTCKTMVSVHFPWIMS